MSTSISLDQAVTSLKEHFRNSPKPNTLDDKVVDFTAKVIESISKDPELSKVFRFNKATDKIGRKTKKMNAKEILPPLLDRVVDVFRQEGLKESDLKKIKIYLSGDHKNPQYAVAEEFFKSSPAELRDRILIGRGIIQYEFPLAVVKRMNVDYGLDEKHLAVPFDALAIEGNMPPRMVGVDFANPWDKMVFTMIYHIRDRG